MGKVCKKSWIAAIFLGVMLFAAGFAFQASTVDAQAATTGFRTVIGKRFYYKNGKDVTEHFSYEGCIIICIESTLKQEPTHLMIEALAPSVVYLLPYNKLLTLTEISWEINMFYRKILEYSLIVSQIKADSWRFETARERYNKIMEHKTEDNKRATMSHIESYQLMTPETLSRVSTGIL